MHDIEELNIAIKTLKIGTIVICEIREMIPYFCCFKYVNSYLTKVYF